MSQIILIAVCLLALGGIAWHFGAHDDINLD